MKKSAKALVIAMILVLTCGVLAGCGSKEEGDDATVKTYIAATEPTYAPFDTTDEEGNIVGFDMDLLNAIGEDQGFKVEYQSFEFDAIVPAIQAGNADIIAAAMNVTEKRAEQVDFSDKYFDSGKVILVKKDNDTIKDVNDFTADMKVAAQIGTTEGEYVQKLADEGKIGEAVVLNKTTDCILQLQNGDVNAIIMDAPVAKFYSNKYGDEIKKLDATIDPAPMAFAVQKGNDELLEKINAGLKNLKENGTYDELVKKWFESDAASVE
ncbi:MAG: basic amino acid ABC transporter substrate-binding protein [Anaerovoracaceae bacterium]|nr:basic amino acid ABC transporter substrate-binding protein [Bacillota bacterium]MEE0516990.1 basic amino acid ABC transporter substrate-binding protein [Anaerovoracaceae bacterium]